MLIKAVIANYLRPGMAVDEKSATIKKLLKMIFGAKTEKTPTVRETKDKKAKPKGHGRIRADAYTGSEKVTVSHPLKVERPVSGV
jgi:transposase